MATIIKKDDRLFKKEEAQNRERDIRDRYIETLRTSPRFQKYIIRDIFESKLDEISESVFKLESDDDIAMAKGLRLAQLNKASILKLISPLKP